MKILKIGIHFWITITSMLSFLTGWILLAHAPKPDQSHTLLANPAVSAPTLEPLPPLSSFSTDGENIQNQPSFSVEPSTRSQFRPAFRTGGS
jgi:hypothetical protein